MSNERASGLARFVASVEEFLTDDFGCRPHRSSRHSTGDVLTIEDVDAILTGSGLRRPAIRVVRDGDIVDPKRWTKRARTGSMWIDDLIHPGKVMDEFAGGSTIVLQSLHRWWPTVSELCRELELDLGHAVQANAYLTPSSATGFDPHHDTHDVFVVQLHGTKDWVVREPIVESPLARHKSDHDEAACQPVQFETRLEPGDCLYLPRGHIHSASTETGASLHLTIGVLATTAHDVLRRLVSEAAEDPRFRRSMPAHYGTDPVVAAAAVKEVVSEFTDWLTHVDTETFSADALRRFDRGRRPILGGQLLELLGVDDVGDEHQVAIRPGTRWRLDVDDDRAVLHVGDRRIELPAVVEPVLHRLLDGATHPVRELSDLMDASSRGVLVRRLIRDGVLVTIGR